MNADQIRSIDAGARLHFTYRPDGSRDLWRSHADAVLSGRAWAGDCDDLASTVLDLLGRAGLALEKRYRLAASTRGTETVDHLIAAAMDANGGFWIVGDTFGPAYPAGRCRHRLIEYQNLAEVRTGERRWRAGAPWPT